MKKKFYLSKHKNGRYYIYYFNAENRRQSVSTHARYKSEALSVLNDFRDKRLNTPPVQVTLQKFRFEFLKASESYHSWKTTLDYRSTFNELEKEFGNISLSQLTQNSIDAFIQRKTREKSAYTGRRHLINIKALLNRAQELGYIEKNPAKSIKRFRIPEKLPVFLSKLEYQQLLNTIDDDDYRDVIEFAANTGLRQMEILTLQRNQFNENARIILLDNQNHTTKSKRVRTIPLNSKAFEILTRRVGIQLFTRNSRLISPDHLQEKFRKYVKSAGIDRKITFHSLRHSFASWLVQAGVSIYEVSKLLGHADIETTQIYAHLRGDDLRRAVNLLD